MGSNDPCCWPGTDCLINKKGTRDPELLAVVEGMAVQVRSTVLRRELLPGVFDLRHLPDFHRYLFQDLYDWAGQTRTAWISKAGVRFASPLYVNENVQALLGQLAREEHLTTMPGEEFLARLAYYYGELNVIHPFREGNGRTSRAFLAQMSAAAGWYLDWSQLSAEDNVDACREHMVTAEVARLVEVLRPVVSQM